MVDAVVSAGALLPVLADDPHESSSKTNGISEIDNTFFVGENLRVLQI